MLGESLIESLRLLGHHSKCLQELQLSPSDGSSLWTHEEMVFLHLDGFWEAYNTSRRLLDELSDADSRELSQFVSHDPWKLLAKRMLEALAVPLQHTRPWNDAFSTMKDAVERDPELARMESRFRFVCFERAELPSWSESLRNLMAFEADLHALRSAGNTASNIESDSDCEENGRKSIDGKPNIILSRPGPKGPPPEQIREWQELERDWLRYRAHCEDNDKRARQNEDWQRWRCKNGDSNSELALEDAIQRRQEFKQHLKRHPEDAVSIGNSDTSG